MNTEQAFVEGFVKRASEYGYSDVEAITLLKESGALGDAWGGLKNWAGNAWEGTKNFVKNNGFQELPTAEETAAYNQRAYKNYAQQIPQRAVTPPVAPPVVSPQSTAKSAPQQIKIPNTLGTLQR